MMPLPPQFQVEIDRAKALFIEFALGVRKDGNLFNDPYYSDWAFAFSTYNRYCKLRDINTRRAGQKGTRAQRATTYLQHIAELEGRYGPCGSEAGAADPCPQQQR